MGPGKTRALVRTRWWQGREGWGPRRVETRVEGRTGCLNGTRKVSLSGSFLSPIPQPPGTQPTGGSPTGSQLEGAALLLPLPFTRCLEERSRALTLGPPSLPEAGPCVPRAACFPPCPLRALLSLLACCLGKDSPFVFRLCDQVISS